MAELPEGRTPLTWKDMEFAERPSHPSTWEAEAKQLRAENERLRYVLGGVRRAIQTGRNEPLMIWKEQIDIALMSEKGGE